MGSGERVVHQNARGAYGSVKSVALTPDGQKGISGSEDGTVRIWELESGECLKVLDGQTKNVNSVALTTGWTKGDLGGGVIRRYGYGIWRAERASRCSRGIRLVVTSVALTPDGLKGISGSYDKTVRVWELNSHIPDANRQSTKLNCEGLILDGSRGLSQVNLARFIELGALGCASPELLAPLSDLVPHQASLLNSLVALMEYSAKDASIVTQLSVEIKHRFLSYLWDIVLSSRDLPMRGIESGQAITLLNWAGVSMNADSLAKMGIKDLRGVRIVDADLSYADLSGVDMTGADCQGVRCCFANLKGVSWHEANLNNLKGLLESLPLL